MSDSLDKTTEYQRAYGLGNYRGLRFAALLFLGSYCSRCACETTRVLQIDHVEKDGKAHRESLSTKGGIAMMTAILKDIKDGNSNRYQVLCANCHMIKTQEDYE